MKTLILTTIVLCGSLCMASDTSNILAVTCDPNDTCEIDNSPDPNDYTLTITINISAQLHTAIVDYMGETVESQILALINSNYFIARCNKWVKSAEDTLTEEYGLLALETALEE